MRRIVIAAIVAAIVAPSLSFGCALYSTDHGLLSFRDPDIWILAAVLFISIGCVVFLLQFFVAKIASVPWPKFVKEAGLFIYSLKPSSRFLLFFVVIILCWVPAFIALYPGYYGCDGPLQVQVFINDGKFPLQFSSMHTLFLCFCLKAGEVLLGSWNAGLTLYCVLQGVLLAAAMAYAAEFLIRYKAPPLSTVFLTLVFACNPVVQTYAFTTAGDSTFAAFLLVSLILLARCLIDENALKEKKIIVLLFLSLAGVCLFRSQGLYVVLLFALVVLVLKRRSGLSLAGIAAGAVVASLVFGFCIQSFFPTLPDPVSNKLNLPSQQIARVYTYEKASLTDGQIERIEHYYDGQKLLRYSDYLSDQSKTSLIDSAFNEDPLGYVQLWVELGISHVGTYSQALLWNYIGYLYPSAAVENDRSGLTPFNEFDIHVDGWAPVPANLFPAYFEWLYDGSQHMFNGNVMLTLWVCIALPAYVLIFSWILFMQKKRNPFLLVWLLPCLYLASFIIGPIVSIRYVAPLFYCAPLLVMLPIMSWSCGKEKNLLE